jgi:hypothetical protein
MNNSNSTIKRHPVVAFYILAFVISWLGWIPQTLHGRGLSSFDSPLLNFLGVGGPTLAAQDRTQTSPFGMLRTRTE